MSSSLIQPPNSSEYPWPAAVLQVLIPFPSSPRGKECSSPDRICGSPQLIDIISHESLRARIDRKKENCQLLHLARWLPPSPKRKQPLPTDAILS